MYDLDRAEVGGFDVIYVGSILVHLREPVRALEQIRSVADGQVVIVDGIDPVLSLLLPRMPVARFDGIGRPWWWWANTAGLKRMIESAGLEHTASPRRLYMPPGKAQSLPRPHPRLLRTPDGRASPRVELERRPARRLRRAAKAAPLTRCWG